MSHHLRQHCEALVTQLAPSQAFGVIRVQRLTKLGYTEANELIRFGIDAGYLERIPGSPFKFQVAEGGMQ